MRFVLTADLTRNHSLKHTRGWRKHRGRKHSWWHQPDCVNRRRCRWYWIKTLKHFLVLTCSKSCLWGCRSQCRCRFSQLWSPGWKNRSRSVVLRGRETRSAVWQICSPPSSRTGPGLSPEKSEPYGGRAKKKTGGTKYRHQRGFNTHPLHEFGTGGCHLQRSNTKQHMWPEV